MREVKGLYRMSKHAARMPVLHLLFAAVLLLTTAGLAYADSNCIGQLKAQPLGTQASLTGRVVTGAFGDFFYIQDTEPGHTACGIKVAGSSTKPVMGDAVDVEGTLGRDQNDELVLNASAVSITGRSTLPRPFGRTNADSGGGSIGSALGADIAAGINTIGTLQVVWGVASRVLDRVTMTVDDGSGTPITVIAPAGGVVAGDMVRVTGISCIIKDNGCRKRALRTRSSADIEVITKAVVPPAEPLIDLRASDLSASSGVVSTWLNAGSLRGKFDADQSFPAETSPTIQTLGGWKCVSFDGTDRLMASFATPASLSGPAVYTVAYWAYNPAFSAEETVVSWAPKDALSGSAAEFNFGNSTTGGAVVHGPGAADMGFGYFQPSASAWHYVAITFDGAVEKCYIDGVLVNQANKNLSFAGAQPIYVGCGYETFDIGYNTTSYLSGALSSLQVYDVALSGDQVKDLYSKSLTLYTVSGKVRDKGSLAIISGAKVFFGTNAPGCQDPAFTATTDSTGSYSVTLPAGSWHVVAGANKYVNTADAVLDVAGNVSPYDLALSGTGGGTLVFLDAGNLALGNLSSWSNSGVLTGAFTSVGGNPTVETVYGRKGVTFHGTEAMKSAFTVPVGSTGNGDWGMYMLVANPTFDADEAPFSWSSRGGPAGSLAQINFSNSATSGAVSHGGGLDMAYPMEMRPGVWHNIVINYSGTTETVIADGITVATADRALNIRNGMPFFVGSGYSFDGSSFSLQSGFTGTVGRLMFADQPIPLTTAQNYALNNPSYTKVMPLGDSITDGYNVPGGYRIKLWSDISGVYKHVNFVGSQSNGPTALPDRNHEGHPGWQASDLLPNIDNWMNAATPEIVLLHIGTNDIYYNATVPTILDRLSQLIDKICAKLPANGKLYVAQIIPWGTQYPGLNTKVLDYNAQIPTLVAQKVSQGKPVYVVDMYAVVGQSDLADGVHPTAAGYDKMAGVWFNAIKDDLAW